MQETEPASKNCADCGKPLSQVVMASGLTRCTPCSAERLEQNRGEKEERRHPPRAAKEGSMFCTQCGAVVPNEHSFCTKCGRASHQTQLAINAHMQSPEVKAERRDKYIKHIALGALFAIGGAVVTLATYSSAEGGGTYIIAWGAMGVGALQFLYGLYGWLSD